VCYILRLLELCSPLCLCSTILNRVPGRRLPVALQIRLLDLDVSAVFAEFHQIGWLRL